MLPYHELQSFFNSTSYFRLLIIMGELIELEYIEDFLQYPKFKRLF